MERYRTKPETMLIVWCLVGARHTCGVTYNLRRLIKPRDTSVWVINSLRGTKLISSQSQRIALIVTIGSFNQPVCLCLEVDQTGGA